jgi:hypothetical protein
MDAPSIKFKYRRLVYNHMQNVQLPPKRSYTTMAVPREQCEKLLSLKVSKWEPFYAVIDRLIQFYETNNCPKIERSDSHV